jgi:hypothetical protein
MNLHDLFPECLNMFGCVSLVFKYLFVFTCGNLCDLGALICVFACGNTILETQIYLVSLRAKPMTFR